jgi:hypothetical protein
VLDINVSQNDSIEARSGSQLKLSEIPERLQQFHIKASQAFQTALTDKGLQHYRGF